MTREHVLKTLDAWRGHSRAVDDLTEKYGLDCLASEVLARARARLSRATPGA